jgi:hypothetical protein
MLAVASVAALVALARTSVATTVGAIGTAIVFAHWMLVLWALPDFERYKPVPHLARAIQQVALPETRVAMHKGSPPSLVFYLRRHIDQPFDATEVSAFLKGPVAAYCVMQQEEYERMKPLIGVPTSVFAASPRFDAQLRDFLERKPLPNLVVVTNRAPQ